MNERELKRSEHQTKRSRERMLRERRRLRRRRKLLRFVVVLLLIFVALLIFILGRFLGNRLIVPAMSREMKLSWDFGSAEIVLDAGHGGKDQGANGGDAIEKEITLAIAKKAEKYLKEAGYKVKMTRDDDTFVELEERAEYANRKGAKAYVSIHCNSSEDGEGNGIETFYAEEKEEQSQMLAQLIQESTVLQTGARDREVKTANYAVIVRTEMPAALVETGFLSDSNERELLQKDEYQEKLAKGIAEGIINYLEQSEQKTIIIY